MRCAKRGLCLLWAGLLAGIGANAVAAGAPTDWQNWVDGLRVRASFSAPDGVKDEVKSKVGDCCQVQFQAFELAQDGSRQRLLDGAPFGQEPRQVVIGQGREKSALELGLIGLLPGEGRQVHAPARHWPGAKGDVFIELQLISRRPGISIQNLQALAAPGAKRAGKGDAVSFTWTLSLLDDKGDPGEPVLPTATHACVIGDASLIDGLDLGLRGMAAGETRAITIPPYLAYGKLGAGGDLIPPESKLWVVVEMKSVKAKN